MWQPHKENAATIKIESPLVNEEEMKAMRASGRKIETLPTFWDVKDGPTGLAKAVKNLCDAAEKAVRAGAEILVLSDYSPSAPTPEKTYIPPLLAGTNSIYLCPIARARHGANVS